MDNGVSISYESPDVQSGGATASLLLPPPATGSQSPVKAVMSILRIVPELEQGVASMTESIVRLFAEGVAPVEEVVAPVEQVVAPVEEVVVTAVATVAVSGALVAGGLVS